jgi:hypothetical protein
MEAEFHAWMPLQGNIGHFTRPDYGLEAKSPLFGLKIWKPAFYFVSLYSQLRCKAFVGIGSAKAKQGSCPFSIYIKLHHA